MAQKKHFSQLSRYQLHNMWNACVDGAIKYAKNTNMSGLSEMGSHNIYKALEKALFDEWKKAKEAKKS